MVTWNKYISQWTKLTDDTQIQVQETFFLSDMDWRHLSSSDFFVLENVESL